MNESLSFEEKLKLESWGLPKYIQMMYERRGIKSMFPWQVECLSVDGVLDGRNLIYSAPTSAGKTLVAEILCLQSVLEKKKKALIILPFVSVVREKMFYFQDIVCDSGIRVEGFMGSYHPPGGFKAVNIAICTIEKANNLINRLMEDEELDEIGCIVVDELHMLGDPHRGYLLELLLTKIKFISKRQGGVSIQIVGMSATLPNLDMVAKWLDAALYKTDFRPIPLQEYLKVDKAVYSASSGYLYDIKPSFTIKNDPGDVIYLCIDTILMGYSILVFCPTKSWCESLAQQISNEIRQLGNDSKKDVGQALRAQLNSEGISDILERLKRCPVGLDQNLGRSIAFGVSFHHAGLTLDERDIVEGSFKEGLLRVLVATTTLSSGVNLPARRVLVRSPLFNSRLIDVLTYKQMVGRAGRMGRDTQGESFLICSEKEKEMGMKLISSELSPVSSCLASSDLTSSFTRAILEVVASGVAKNKSEIEEYAACTLVHACDEESLKVPLATCLSYLETNEFIRSLQDGNIAPSPLAQATLSASLYPHQAVKLLQELHRASTSFILSNHLHAIYQVTPYSVSDQWSVDWVKMFNAWERLSSDMKAVGQLVGVEESFLIKAMRTNVSNDDNAKKLSVHRRFYTALALQDLINEVPLSMISGKYSCNKGMLQSLQQSASTFAGMVTRFCERLGWTGLEAILEQLSSRIEYGAQRDLLDLLRLDCFTSQVARALHSSGIKTIPELASASSLLVQQALTKLVPFLSEEMKPDTKTSKCIWISGKSGLTEAEAAQYFICRARKFILEEMGVSNANWKSEDVPINKDIDSIYLNSTVNPYDTSKDVNISKRKISLNEIIEPINRSTPVNTIASQRKTEHSTTVEKCFNEPEISENFVLPVNEEISYTLGNFRTSSPLIVNEDTKRLVNLTAGSPIVVNNISLNKMDASKNPINDPHFKTNRLSMGDLFESFDFRSASNVVLETECLEGISDAESNNVVTDNQLNSIIAPRLPNAIDPELVKNLQDHSKDELNPKTYLESNPDKISCLTSSKNSNELKNSKIEKSKTRNSLDIFFDSFSFNNSSFSQAVVAVCEENGKVLEELDCNWGGESILETSLILNNICKQYSPVSLKRKLSTSGEIVEKKRRKNSIAKDSHGESSMKNNQNIDQTSSTVKPNEIPVLNNVTNSKPTSSNRKNFKKHTSSKKNFKTLATSTQMYPSEVSDVSKVVNFDFGTCTEVSVVKKIESSSDDSIIESPTLPAHSYKNKISSKLQASNVSSNISRTVSKNENCKLFRSAQTHQLSIGLTNSYLEAAFGETFCDLVPHVPPNPISSVEKNYIKINSPQKKVELPNEIKLISSKNKESSSFSNLTERGNSNSNLLRRVHSKDVILESQDVFMTPPREYRDEEMIALTEEVIVKTPTKVKATFDSPIKTFKERQRRDNSVSPHRSKNYDSPSKYNKLNVKIIKTPEKTVNINNSSGNITPNDADFNGVPQYVPDELVYAQTLLKSPLVEKTLTETNEIKTPTCKKSLKMSNRPLVDNTSSHSENLVETPLQNFENNEVICKNIKLKEGFDFEKEAENKTFTVTKSRKKVFKNTDSNEDNCAKKLIPSSINKYFSSSCMNKEKHASNPSNPDNECNINQSSTLHKDIKQNGTCNKENDVIKTCPASPQLIFPCQSFELMKEFETFLSSCSKVAISLEISKLGERNSRIGSKIKKSAVCNENKLERKFITESLSLDGLAFYSGQDVYYINLLCKSGLCLDILIYLFNKCDLSLYICDVRDKLKLIYKCLGITVECQIIDPLIGDWLLDPQEKSRPLSQLMKVYAAMCKVPTFSHNLCTEEVMQVWHVMSVIEEKLGLAGLLNHFISIEMPLSQILIHMELTGIGFDILVGEDLMKNITSTMQKLEEKAHKVADRIFNISSRNELAKVKKILNISLDNEKDHPLMIIVRDWRKLHSLKTRNLSSLMLEPKARLHPVSDTKTATGRIILYEPDLQHMPRDFIVNDICFNSRACFVPSEGNVFVAADYCQLELRILAHFSKDEVLMRSFASDKDVFKDIAANWNRISIDEVDDHMRHKAKQICYGLIYGMGYACLGDKLGITTTEAATLQAEFKRRYPGVKSFIENTIAECKKTGLIKTLFGRSRFLSHITSSNPAFSKQGERQAVNSIIQGTASDIAKKALVKIESTLNELIPQRSKIMTDQCACHLVLHLHDEFIYEVSSKYVDIFISVIKNCMEEAVELSLPLPVKVKSGYSWGLLESVT